MVPKYSRECVVYYGTNNSLFMFLLKWYPFTHTITYVSFADEAEIGKSSLIPEAVRIVSSTVKYADMNKFFII